MGLKADLQTEIGAAFVGDLADAVKTFDFTSVDNEPSYDPDSGVGASNTVLSNLTGAFVDYTVKELISLNTSLTEQEKVRSTDVKLIALQNVLTTEPKKGDSVLVSGGKVYRVLSWKQDPAEATYEVQLRTMADE